MDLMKIILNIYRVYPGYHDKGCIGHYNLKFINTCN